MKLLVGNKLAINISLLELSSFKNPPSRHLIRNFYLVLFRVKIDLQLKIKAFNSLATKKTAWIKTQAVYM
jgi:hypothetical protein